MVLLHSFIMLHPMWCTTYHKMKQMTNEAGGSDFSAHTHTSCGCEKSNISVGALTIQQENRLHPQSVETHLRLSL